MVITRVPLCWSPDLDQCLQGPEAETCSPEPQQPKMKFTLLAEGLPSRTACCPSQLFQLECL